MSTLFEIVQDHKSLDQIMLEQGGEITSEQQQHIVEAWMNEIQSDLAAKADGYKYKMDMLEAAEENLKERAKMIASAAKVLSGISANLKERMKIAIKETGSDEILGNDFKFKISNGKSSVVVFDESQIPATFTREKVIIEIDKALVKEALEAGQEVLGAKLEQSTTLRVTANKKVKELNGN